MQIESLKVFCDLAETESFTKAAQSLGVTQPAVSAQIKRLQYLLGYEVLDKSAPGVSLTPRGEIVVNNARRLLSINDEILQLTSGTIPGQVIRVVHGDVQLHQAAGRRGHDSQLAAAVLGAEPAAVARLQAELGVVVLRLGHVGDAHGDGRQPVQCHPQPFLPGPIPGG